MRFRNQSLSRALALITLALVLGGCLEYSPHAIPLDEVDTDVHRKSLERLFARPEPELLKLAVVGDTQGDFTETKAIIDLLNQEPGLAFVIQVGDLTHQGIGPEYREMNALFRRLIVPYFVVLGNHDLLANGADIYDRMFGDPNLAFTYARTRIVLFDSNGVEYGWDGKRPDFDVLESLLANEDEYDQAILFSHIDPSSPDFDPALREPYFAFVRHHGVTVSFYGHGHDPHEFERDGAQFYLPGAADRHTFFVVSVQPDGRIDVDRRRY